RAVHPILLLDDVSSELDRSRTSALFDFLIEREGQVFLTTTRPELIDTGALSGPTDRRDFSVEKSSVRRLGVALNLERLTSRTGPFAHEPIVRSRGSVALR